MDVNQPIKGMNMDSHPMNLDGQKAYTFALNARQESEDGNEFNITNESTNTLAVTNWPDGYKIIGRLNIVDYGRTIYWLTNPNTGDCEIGFVLNDPLGCIDTLNTINPPDTGNPVFNEPSALSTTPCMVYNTIVSASCLNFSVMYPIHDARYKITNRTIEIYWTDNYNPPRWMDLNNPPYLGTGNLDCNLLSVFPDYDTPEIKVVEVLDTGSLKVGSYQFMVAYSNSVGAPLSQYYSPSNPCPIWENKESETLSFDTSKAIKIRLSNLDTEFKYVNIIAIKTINFTQTFELVATLNIPGTELEFTYTGNDKTLQPLTREEVYFRAPYYKTAGTLETQNRVLMMGNLVTEERINYQPIASALELMWETWRVPYSKFEAYNNGANGSNLRSYMRDEIYPFDMVVIEKSGRVSDRFHIPGRTSIPTDRDIVANDDALNTEPNPCDPSTPKQAWEVYNTGTNEGFVGVLNDPCYIGPWEYGKMGYWESERRYPNNPIIWGPLAGQLIRHHKFPDNIITHIHDNNPGNDIGYEHAIYPIGVKFDINNIMNAIQNSPLTQTQKDNIAAIRILRGNRRTNKSVQAAGLVFNVGSYKFQDQDFLYPNYPFNDTNPDVFLSTETKDPITGLYTSAAPPYSGTAPYAQLNGFTGEDKQRFSFISPDTSFIRPSLSGQLKLETAEFGLAKAHIIQVQDNPRYEIGTQKGVKMAVLLALTTILSVRLEMQIGTTTSVNPSLDISFANFLPAFLQAYDMISKLVPFEQYGYQYNAVGNYCNYMPVSNTGNKIRLMTSVGYIGPGIETIPGETAAVNNFQRESSVFIKTLSSLPYPWDIGAPRDNSRFTFASYLAQNGVDLADGQRVNRDISAFYAKLKRRIPDQYGEIHSYQALDTGYTLRLDQPLPTVFGGDTYINRFAIKRKLPFFIQNTVGQAANTDIDYSSLGNVSYPTYYMSTSPLDPRISNSLITAMDNAYNFLTSFFGILLSILSALLVPYAVVVTLMLVLVGEIVSTLGIKKVNLDRFHDEGFYLRGVFYLFAYGIPYFFVESDFNVDYRQATNGLEGNYFPRVGTDIPDFWLQEKNVSIAYDNLYTYNRDLSKQNVEDFYTYLPENWSPVDNSYVHETRVIYSEPYSIEEQQNNWLLFRANNYWDFTYNNGSLIALRAIEQDKVMTLFENNFSVYNAYITLPTNIKDAITGSGSMFSNPPIEYSRTDIGYAGSQQHAFTSTPYGHFWVDARRGCVFQMTAQGPTDIARKGMMNWFKENLPFKILRHFPNYNVDNNYNGVGIALVWDNRFNRLFITKKDYIPLNDNIVYKDNKFYISDSITTTFTDSEVVSHDGGDIEFEVFPRYEEVSITQTTEGLTEIQLCDPEYFCDASWTIAYSPMTESWVSFYSFLPNFYTEQQNFFQSCIQDCQNPSLWNHLLTNKSYQTFYNTFCNFEVEPITKPELVSGTLTSLNYRMDIYRYENEYDWRYMKDVTFTNAIISSTTQTSGMLDMIVHDKRDLTNGLFATQNVSSISVSVSSLDNLWRLNKFSDVTKDANSLKALFNYTCSNAYKELNDDALDYSKPFDMSKKQRLKSDWFKIRLINSVHARYKFIFKWIGDKVQKMIR